LRYGGSKREKKKVTEEKRKDASRRNTVNADVVGGLVHCEGLFLMSGAYIITRGNIHRERSRKGQIPS
jgi:hypothetical protein